MTTFHGTYGLQNKWKKKYNSIMTRGERVIGLERCEVDVESSDHGGEFLPPDERTAPDTAPEPIKPGIQVERPHDLEDETGMRFKSFTQGACGLVEVAVVGGRAAEITDCHLRP